MSHRLIQLFTYRNGSFLLEMCWYTDDGLKKVTQIKLMEKAILNTLVSISPVNKSVQVHNRHQHLMENVMHR